MSSAPSQATRISLPELRAQIDGDLVGSDDPAFDEARAVFLAASTGGRNVFRLNQNVPVAEE